MSGSKNTLISPMMMAQTLTVMLHHPEVDPEAYVPVRVVGFHPDEPGGYSTWFCHHGRYAGIRYPARDLTLSIDEFSGRYLHNAARLLLG